MNNKYNKYRTLIVVLLISATIMLLGILFFILYNQYIEDKEYDNLVNKYVDINSKYENIITDKTVDKNILNSEDKKEVKEDVEVDIESLKNLNSDYVGWIYMADTGINYPIVQGNDNEEYLRTSIYNNPSDLGSIFLDFNNNRDFSDDNTIIYGHMVYDGSDKMFTSLLNFKDYDYFVNHQTFKIIDINGIENEYQIFAILHFDITSFDLTKVYKQTFRSSEHRNEYINELINNSLFNTGVNIPNESKLITLSTCDKSLYGDNGRFVVVGYLK